MNAGLLPFLDTFLLAAETGTFTAVAKELRLTQAAVSQRIQKLERHLKTSLFDRTGGRLTLTPAGETLYGYARKIDELSSQAHREITGREPTIRKTVLAIAASSIPGEYLLPTILATFCPRYPSVRVQAKVSDSVDVIDLVQRGDCHLGMVGRTIESDQLGFRRLASDRMVIVTPKNHPLARKKTVSIELLKRYPLILREPGSGIRHSFERALRDAGESISDLKIALELGSNEAIKQAVMKGSGVAILSEWTVKSKAHSRHLTVRELAGIRTERDLYLVVHRQRLHSQPVRWFLEHLDTHPIAP